MQKNFAAATLLTLVCLTTTISCVSKPNKQTLGSTYQTLNDPTPEIVAVEEKLPEPIKDAIGNDFCKDDIFATHLRQKRLEEINASLAGVRSARERRRLQQRSETDAIHYARSRIQGHTEQASALPVVYNPEVEWWIRYFNTRGRQTFLRWLIRAESAKELIEPILSEQGMPSEFIYLAMIESGFSNTARSHARAVGTWQFMLGTARLYGLRVNHWVDERRDPEKATIAAASFLKDLYDQFGDWYLAMAAYNSGPGRIRGAIRRGGTNDYWQLAQRRLIPRETQNYVPKVLAAMIISQNREAYGFEVSLDVNDQLPTNEALLSRPVRLQELASQLGTTVNNIRRWNPELINDITPPLQRDQTAYRLRLPEQYAENFVNIENNLAYLEISDVQMHRISQGETLSHIARRYRVTIRDIINVNPRIQPTRLRIGREIAIPIPGINEAQRPGFRATRPEGTT